MQNLQSKGPQLNALSLKECLLLTMRIERRCADQLELLAARVIDSGLRTRLTRMIIDEQDHLRILAELDEEIPWPALLRINERLLNQLGTQHVPALAAEFDKVVGEEAALDFVRELEEQSAQLYQCLAERTEDSVAKAAFLRIANAEQVHLAHFLREE
jgi:rubrerythrin